MSNPSQKITAPPQPPPSVRWTEILGWLLLVSAVLVGLGMTIWPPI